MVGHAGHQQCHTCSQHIFDDNPLVKSARARHVCHVCHWHAPDCKSLVVHWRFSGHVQVCKCCAGGFVAPAEFEHHLLQYFGCATCHYHHESPEKLVRHNSEQKFSCNTCGIKECKLDNFRAHMKATRHGPFCFGCNVQFTSPEDLTNHFKEEHVQACSICHEHGDQLDEPDLRSHVAAVHGQCPTCYVTASSYTELEIHLQDTHHGAMCRDEDCRMFFGTGAQLFTHLANHSACPVCHGHFADMPKLIDVSFVCPLLLFSIS